MWFLFVLLRLGDFVSVCGVGSVCVLVNWLVAILWPFGWFYGLVLWCRGCRLWDSCVVGFLGCLVLLFCC